MNMSPTSRETQTSSLPEQDGIVGLTPDHSDGQPLEEIGLPGNTNGGHLQQVAARVRKR